METMKGNTDDFPHPQPNNTEQRQHEKWINKIRHRDRTEDLYRLVEISSAARRSYLRHLLK